MTLVVDASVFNKLFLQEADTPIAAAFFRATLNQDLALLAPTLLRQEMCSTALYYGINFSVPLLVLNTYLEVNLSLVEPVDDVWLLAEKITRSGNKKSGYPTLQDTSTMRWLSTHRALLLLQIPGIL